jgi:glyoxylase-like metal-dependent hydrolase (beta-lactamase superfamily II)
MFRLLHDAASGCMGYLLADGGAGEAVLIDPRGADVPALRALLAEHRLRLRWILRTHEHDAMLLRESSALVALGAPVVERQVPHGGSGSIRFGGEDVQVLATPGHTATCLSFAWRDRVFCGGLMAADTCPYQPWPVQPEGMWNSVQRHIFPLPDETLLFSGHSLKARVVSTVKEQRLNHPWFAQTSRESFLARARAAVFPPRATQHEEPVRLQH